MFTDGRRMQANLSNQVIARMHDEVRNSPRRTLDLGNIHTPELGLLSPQRSEIAPRGRGRDAALVAYSERLRHSYKTNEGGIRDGMLKLGQAWRGGQSITVSCFCRAGELCHADVVKKAIEKVGEAMKVRENSAPRLQELAQDPPAVHGTNPRTARAINEILSVGRSDLILSKLEDTEGRSRIEHASHLNGYSQFVRDLYERGAVVREGVLIAPKENSSSPAPLAVTTVEYAVKKLEPILNESRAKELAPQIVEYGARIAGGTADRDTKIKVFSWIYSALEGRNDFLQREDKLPESETKEERFDRTLGEIAELAEEMSRLEPSDKLTQLDKRTVPDASEPQRSNDELLLVEEVYETAMTREDEQGLRASQGTTPSFQEFERVELGNTVLSQLTADMTKVELDKWIDIRLPVIDDMLETGTPVNAILKLYENDIYLTSKNDPANKQASVRDLKFATAYIEHQLKQPESRLRHFNPRYRNYAAMLDTATSRSEVMDTASRIRLENAKLGFQWESLTKAEKAGTERPLTAKEMQFLLTEASPRHYTSEMTAVRLAYSNAGQAAKTKTDALIRGEITPSLEALQLIESLESRLERRRSTDSLSGTKHFLQSLKTSNEDLRYKNVFDHSAVYRKLPPAEKDFVYQRAVRQKENLEIGLPKNDRSERPQGDTRLLPENRVADGVAEFRKNLKSDLAEMLERNPDLSGANSTERMKAIVNAALERSDLLSSTNKEAISVLSAELGERIDGYRPLHHKPGRLVHDGGTPIKPDRSVIRDSPMR